MNKPLAMFATVALLGASLLPSVSYAQEANPSVPASLVPPLGLSPFSDLPVSDIEGDSASYRVVYGPIGDSDAVIYGRVGTDDATPGLIQSFTRCSPTALYCTENILGRDDTPPGDEIFRGLSVNGQDATVVHVNCCNGVHWAIQWYDPAANVTYALELDQTIAVPYGDTITPTNLASAKRLAELAAQLVPADS